METIISIIWLFSAIYLVHCVLNIISIKISGYDVFMEKGNYKAYIKTAIVAFLINIFALYFMKG